MNRWFQNMILAASLFGLTMLPALAQPQNAPFAGGGAPNVKDPAVEKLEADAKKLDGQLKAKPKDAALKTKTAEAYFQAGHACEYSKVLPPRAKYRGALKLYRRALELNPKHA